ncbi:MAG: PAS domain S-box protein [Gallionella sp.]|nr:PAS domain S-box protein [Gallionella sp.]
MIFKPFNRLPLRFSLPLVVLVSFLFATLISLMIGLHQAHEQLLEAASQHARAEAHRFARRAENELSHDTKDVRRMIMLHAAEVEDFNSTMTALLDPQGRVIYSFRSDWSGREFGAVHPGWDKQRFLRVQQGITSDISLDVEHEKLSVLTPYLYPRDESRIASIQKGVVYVEYDLRPAYVIARHHELEHHAPHLLAALLAFLLLAWWLRRNLYQPINELSRHTKRIGSGLPSVVSANDFPGELQDLGHSLADMGEQLRREQHNLIQERDRSQQYLATVNAIVVVLDNEGRVQMINRKGCELLGWTETELLGHNWFVRCLPQPQGMTEVYPIFRRMMAGDLQAVEYFENSILAKDGSRHLIAWHNGYFKDDAGNITGTISSGEDISKRAAQEETLRKLNQAVEQSPESIVITDLLGNIEYVNESFVRTTGYAREEVLGRNPRMLQSGKTPKSIYTAMWEALKRGDVWQGEFTNGDATAANMSSLPRFPPCAMHAVNPATMSRWSRTSPRANRMRKLFIIWQISTRLPACPTVPCCSTALK